MLLINADKADKHGFSKLADLILSNELIREVGVHLR
jgi:hypothetical protein